jgi:hypothetical protein
MKTLKTQVLKTATVTGVKPATPADRIGLGLVAAYPTDNLSPGHIPVPRNPEPEQVRSRELSALHPRMRWQAGDDAVPPAGSAGWFPGASADWSASLTPSRITGRLATRTAATGRAVTACRFADPGRAHVPGDTRHHDRLGRDCQSPDRSGDKARVATRVVSPAAAAGK